MSAHHTTVATRDAPSVCYLIGQLGLGGAERQLYLTVRELVQRGWRVGVISFHGGAQDHWENPLREVGVALHLLPCGGAKLSRLRQVAVILRAGSYRVVHAWTFSANLYAAWAGRLAGVAVRIGSERSNQDFTKAALGSFWYHASLRGLDGMVTNSEAAARQLRRAAPNLEVHVVPNGVEVSGSPISAERRKEIRHRFGLGLEAVVVAGVGTLFPSKNFGQLIEVTAGLAPDFPDLQLLFLGDGPLRETLETQARRLLPPGRVVFAGTVPDAGSLLGAFDVLCLPAVGYEGLPNVLLEAAAAGLPAVASDVGGVGEVIADGRTGLIFPQRDAPGLARALRLLLGDAELRRRMGRAASDTIQSRFSVSGMTDNMIKAYLDAGSGPESRVHPCVA